MKVKTYEKVSSIYEHLMKSLDYQSWSEYILLIAKENLHLDAKILELGAGNCKMAKIISEKFKHYYATDISYPMLNYSNRGNVKKVCCDMTSLPFNYKFDLIFSTFDSVNYILKQKSLLKLFIEVNKLLSMDGIFTFDVSLEENSYNYTISKRTDGQLNGTRYQILSKYNKRNRIHNNTFYIWNKMGEEYKESHKEKIYNIKTYFNLAEKAGLHTEACYDCFDFTNVKKKSKRAQFVMRKINR